MGSPVLGFGVTRVSCVPSPITDYPLPHKQHPPLQSITIQYINITVITRHVLFQPRLLENSSESFLLLLLLLGRPRPAPNGPALVLQEGGRQQGVRGALEVLLHEALGRRSSTRYRYRRRCDKCSGEPERGLGAGAGGRVQAQMGLLQDRCGG